MTGYFLHLLNVSWEFSTPETGQKILKYALFFGWKEAEGKARDRMLTIQIKHKMTKTKLKTLRVPIC